MLWRVGRKPGLLALVCAVGVCGVSACTFAPGAGPTVNLVELAAASPSPYDYPTDAPAVTDSPTPAPTPTPPPSHAVTPKPTPTLPPGKQAPVDYHGSRSRKVIAITVDDCFSADAVLADLAVFQKYGVNATWFPIGRVAANHAALWRTVDAAGFPIANHTYGHKDLTTHTYDQDVEDIKHENDLMKSIIGHPILPFMRPYGGSVNAMVRVAASAAGEKAIVNWDVDDGDAEGDYTNVPRLIHMGEQGKNGSILLVHANHEYTTAALPAIIAYYRANGFTFVTLGQMFGVTGPVPYP